MKKDYKIIELFSQKNKTFFQNQIKNCGWKYGKFLSDSIDNGFLFKICGEDARIFLLLNEDKVVSFCTFVHQDEINAPDMFPWISFVYTLEEYRGNRLMGKLFDYIFELARNENYKQVFVSTNEIGLYEKYGFEYYKNMHDITNNDSRIYIKKL